MSLKIKNFLEKYYTSNERIILACSTGADSMFLLYKILQTPYKKNLVACYFNHQTREKCKEEELFLLKLGKKEGFEVEIATCDFKKIQQLYPSKGFEELAREKRYQFFDAVCSIHNTNKVITAHHLDDRIETMLFNMLRGSKLTGLINMTEQSGGILRPLLGIEKTSILQYLKENKLQYFEDESNAYNEHTRNYIRNEILPKFSNVHPEHKKNLKNLLNYFEELKFHLDQEVLEFLKMQSSFFHMKEGGSEKDCKKIFSIAAFNTLSPLLQKEIIRYIYYISNNKSTIGLSQGNIAEVLKFMNGKNNKTKKEIHGMKLFKDGDRISY